MKLDIKQMVIPFRYAVYLKKKGVKQESLYYWVEEENGRYELKTHRYICELIMGKEVPDINVPENSYSAFLTDEISFILKDNKQFNLDKTNFHFEYKDTYYKRNFWEVFSFGAELVQTFLFNERENKYKRDRQPKTPPTPPKPHNPNPHENFR